MALAASNGVIWAEFLKMRIKHARLDKAHQLYDDLRYAKRSCPWSPQDFGAIFAETHSGKSMSVTTYIEWRVAEELIEAGMVPPDMPRSEVAKLQRKVLHFTLSSSATPKMLATDILRALGDKRAASGNVETLRQRVYDLLRFHGTELLVIDEIQHLSAKTSRLPDGRTCRSGITESTAVTDNLKCMLIEGLVPMMFIGITEARHHLFNDAQLASRCVQELDFGRLDFTVPEQKDIFVKYCGRLGLKLRQHGLFEDETNLVEGDIPACMLEVAGGRIGIASKLVRNACEVATAKKARCVTREHLDEATEDWAIRKGVIDYNPFRDGIRSAMLAVA
jgi:hypothetical protein